MGVRRMCEGGKKYYTVQHMIKLRGFRKEVRKCMK